jgi:hypothetical protein
MRQLPYNMLDLTRAFRAQLELLVSWICWTGTLWVRLVPFSVFLARLPPTRLPPARLSACIVSLFGCVHIQSQAKEVRRLVTCTR